MALILCKECKKEFSSDASRCIHCGARKPISKIEKFGGGFCALIISLLVIGYYSDQATHPEQNLAPAAQTEIGHDNKPYDPETTALGLQKCIEQHLLLNDYFTDPSAGVVDNLIKSCQPIYGMAVMACADQCKTKHPATCDFNSCAKYFRDAIQADFYRSQSRF